MGRQRKEGRGRQWGERCKMEGGRRGKNPNTPAPTEDLTNRGRATRPERVERRRGIQRERREKRRGTGKERPHGGPRSRCHVWGRDATPPEENADLPGFAPKSTHLLLQEVYGAYPHHNDGAHLERGIKDDTAWQHY